MVQKKGEPIERLLSTSAAGRVLELSGEYVRRLAKEGKIPSIPSNTGAMFRPADVEAFKREREASPTVRRRAAS